VEVVTNPNDLNYSLAEGQAMAVTPAFLAGSLNAGTNVTLQSNDDISVASPIAASPAAAGNLTLQAGRSILLGASVNSGAGNLALTANDTQADDVVNAYRDPGNAVISETSGTTLNAGAGTLSVDLKSSADKTNNGKGVVTLLNVTAAGTVFSSASSLGFTINGTTPGDGVAAGTYTQLQINGPVNLNGATLVLSAVATVPAGSSLVIVQTTGGVSGTFSGLSEGAIVTTGNGARFQISYQVSYQGNGGDDVVLTMLPATGTAAPVSDGFESGNFSALHWQLSNVAASNWTVESKTVHSGSYAAQSGAVGPGASNSALSVTLTVAAGELSFWRKTSSATGSGSLIFEIDGVPKLQLSGSMPWQQSFFWVSAGTHTFTWLYAKNAGDPAGADFGYLDDVQFTPGTTLTVEGGPSGSGTNVFSFDASSPTIVVALNGEIHTFAAGEFTNYVFQGGGSDVASLTGSASGNSVSLYTSGVGQLTNSSAGYTVNVSGMASIIAVGHPGDTAQFFDSLGNDIFYAYADYAGSGRQLAGMYGPGYSNSAAGFSTNTGTNQGTAAAGATDMAGFFDSPGNDTYYAYTDYDGAPSGSGQQLAGMYGSGAPSGSGGYANSAKGFGTNVGFSMNGGSDTADFYDSLGHTTFYAYADYLGSGQQLAGMLTSASGEPYSDSARGFATNVATSTAGATDTAEFFDSPGSDTFDAYADYNGAPSGSGQTYATLYGSYGGGYANSAAGFATMVASSVNGGSDSASLAGGAGNDTLYTDAAIASLYGNDGSYTEQALGFAAVNAIGGQGVNSKGQGPVSYQLTYAGNWVG
jgi:hypothetical protein